MIIWIVVNNSPLLNKVSFLVNDIFDKLTVLLWKWVSPLGSENVWPVSWERVGVFFFRLERTKNSVELSFFLNMTMVVFETHSKGLIDILRWVGVFEKHFSLLTESTDFER